MCFIGVAFSDVRGQIFPMVGIAAAGMRVKANFGAVPPPWVEPLKNNLVLLPATSLPSESC